MLLMYQTFRKQNVDNKNFLLSTFCFELLGRGYLNLSMIC